MGIHHFWREHRPNIGTGLLILGQPPSHMPPGAAFLAGVDQSAAGDEVLLHAACEILNPMSSGFPWEKKDDAFFGWLSFKRNSQKKNENRAPLGKENNHWTPRLRLERGNNTFRGVLLGEPSCAKP